MADDWRGELDREGSSVRFLEQNGAGKMTTLKIHARTMHSVSGAAHGYPPALV